MATVRLDLSQAEQPQPEPEPEAEADDAETERTALFVAEQLGLDGKALAETNAKRASLLEKIAAGAREELGLEKASAHLSVAENLSAISQKLDGFDATAKAASKAAATDEDKHLKVQHTAPASAPASATSRNPSADAGADAGAEGFRLVALPHSLRFLSPGCGDDGDQDRGERRDERRQRG